MATLREIMNIEMRILEHLYCEMSYCSSMQAGQSLRAVEYTIEIPA